MVLECGIYDSETINRFLNHPVLKFILDVLDLQIVCHNILPIPHSLYLLVTTFIRNENSLYIYNLQKTFDVNGKNQKNYIK